MSENVWIQIATSYPGINHTRPETAGRGSSPALTDWEKYIAPEAGEKLPISNKNFMRIVGVIEMLVGVGILSTDRPLAA